MIPVELMGRTKLPVIGDRPYLLTLGGHDFYWFSVEPSRHASQEQRLSDLGPAPISCTSADALLFGSERPYLEEALPAYLARARMDDRRGRRRADRGGRPHPARGRSRGRSAGAGRAACRLHGGRARDLRAAAVRAPGGLAAPAGHASRAPSSLISRSSGWRELAPAHELLVEASGEAAGRILLEAAARGATYGALAGTVAAGARGGRVGRRRRRPRGPARLERSPRRLGRLRRHATW